MQDSVQEPPESWNRASTSGNTTSGNTGSAATSRPLGAGWNQHLSEVSNRVEQEVHRVVRYLDEEVVPEVRRNGSSALRTAAAELQRMARSLDEHRPPHGPGPHGRP